MNARKVRTHQTGLSNLIARNETEPSTTTKNRMLSPETPHGQKFTDALIKRGKKELSPQKKSERLYETAGRTFKAKAELGYPRSAQLEESDKRKIVFTGESHLLYDKDLEKYRDLESPDFIIPQPIYTKDHLAQEKRDINGTAIQETQLVGYDKYNTDTLKNNVNLEKVREARRILRRKYANRNQLQKIYSAWDEKSQGFIDVEDVYSMSKKLALNLNVDEARVLLASSDRNGNGQLSLDEFLDLIYNKDDVLNVDLDKLSNNLDRQYLVQREELFHNDDGILKKLHSDANKARQNRHMNQVNLVLKNKFNLVSQGLHLADLNKAGYVNFEKFEECIKRLGINENIVAQEDINQIFDKYKSTDQHTMNYKDFLEGLRTFKFHYDEVYSDHKDEKALKRQMTDLVTNMAPSEDFNIVDCRNLPYNVLEDYLLRTKKVNTAVKRYFPTQDVFENYLSESTNIPKDKLAGHIVSKEEVKSVITGLFNHFDNGSIMKKDFQGFLSTMIYNKQGNTNLSELCSLIYGNNDREHYEKISYKKSGLPPSSSLMEIKSARSPDSSSAAESNYFRTATAGFRGFKVEPEDKELEKEMRGIVQKFDDKIFMGRKNYKEVYRSFDLDKDGFVSQGEFAKKVEEMCILDRDEISKLVGYLDPENKGYVNFKEFSSKIRVNMAQQNDDGEPTVLPNICSSKRFNQKYAGNVSDFRTQLNSMIKTSSSSCYASPTRYGASPNWSNTFQNFQPTNKSGMFSPESHRFNKDHNHRIEFQGEEKRKKATRDLARFDLINRNQDMLKSRVNDIDVKHETLVKHNLDKKAAECNQYEKRAKLRNKYAF